MSSLPSRRQSLLLIAAGLTAACSRKPEKAAPSGSKETELGFYPQYGILVLDKKSGDLSVLLTPGSNLSEELRTLSGGVISQPAGPQDEMPQVAGRSRVEIQGSTRYSMPNNEIFAFVANYGSLSTYINPSDRLVTGLHTFAKIKYPDVDPAQYHRLAAGVQDNYRPQPGDSGKHEANWEAVYGRDFCSMLSFMNSGTRQTIRLALEQMKPAERRPSVANRPDLYPPDGPALRRNFYAECKATVAEK